MNRVYKQIIYMPAANVNCESRKWNRNTYASMIEVSHFCALLLMVKLDIKSEIYWICKEQKYSLYSYNN
jgi:hypothetical protein